MNTLSSVLILFIRLYNHYYEIWPSRLQYEWQKNEFKRMTFWSSMTANTAGIWIGNEFLVFNLKSVNRSAQFAFPCVQDKQVWIGLKCRNESNMATIIHKYTVSFSQARFSDKNDRFYIRGDRNRMWLGLG